MTPFLDDGDVKVYIGDALTVLRELDAECVDCVVTSPPYWGLRDYGADGQLGLESTPGEYVQNMAEVFREVRRVLAPHGTVWLNLGDSYASDAAKGGSGTPNGRNNRGENYVRPGLGALKPKDLAGIPWRVAFALQDDGWWLRSDIVWAKPNPMPESVNDRPTRSHEFIFLLTKKAHYYFDGVAVKEPAEWARWGDQTTPKYGGRPGVKGHSIKAHTKEELNLDARREEGRNVRSVWNIATQPYPGAHYAVFPEELVQKCILAGCPQDVCGQCGKPRERIIEVERDLVSGSGRSGRTPQGKYSDGIQGGGETGDLRMGPVRRDMTIGWSDCGHGDFRRGVVLDPFLGSGTTAFVARNNQRHAIGIELSEEYAREHIAKRLAQLSLLA